MATYIKSTCSECQPTLSCITCSLYEAPWGSWYLATPALLPNSIYIGGSRSYSAGTINSVVSGAPSIPTTLWGGVTGGTLLSRSGTSYGNTTNGVILEASGFSYVWAIYTDSVRSTANWLIDGINRHDAFPSSYQVQAFDWGPLGNTTFTIYRIGCRYWSGLRYGLWDSGCSGTYPSWFTPPTLPEGYIYPDLIYPDFGLGADPTEPPRGATEDSGYQIFETVEYNRWLDCDPPGDWSFWTFNSHSVERSAPDDGLLGDYGGYALIS